LLVAYVSRFNRLLARSAELAGILKETEWGDKSRRYYLTRTEEYVEGLKAALGIWCAPCLPYCEGQFAAHACIAKR
jgi:acyl-CoA oxidase